MSRNFDENCDRITWVKYSRDLTYDVFKDYIDNGGKADGNVYQGLCWTEWIEPDTGAAVIEYKDKFLSDDKTDTLGYTAISGWMCLLSPTLPL